MSNQFSNGLFDCFGDITGSLLAFCLPCVVAGTNQDNRTGSGFIGTCLATMCCPVCVGTYNRNARATQHRRKWCEWRLSSFCILHYLYACPREARDLDPIEIAKQWHSAVENRIKTIKFIWAIFLPQLLDLCEAHQGCCQCASIVAAGSIFNLSYLWHF